MIDRLVRAIAAAFQTRCQHPNAYDIGTCGDGSIDWCPECGAWRELDHTRRRQHDWSEPNAAWWRPKPS